ncbi:uncharacterized protein LOC127257719 [Andrographis paniculata]|uniref:uncharacterized protein LOC127257719 n=1 Tax=Andrographis paniculata TaxID=175694 RepID=UPI0021E80148|nr:uncharacterized protein LOC127257719 [Andrographis paniculata]
MANQYVPALPFDGTEPSVPLVTSKVLTPTIRPYCTTTADAERMSSVIVQVSPIIVNNEAFKPERLLDSIKTHLTDPKDAYQKWYARLLPQFENQLETQGIDKAILLSTQPLYLHDKVLMAMAAFWHSQTGAFFLPSGPVGPTLMDVAVIAHLPITGEDPVLVSLGNQELPSNHQGWALAKLPERERGWTYFANKYQGKEDTPVSELEHTAFLLFWLCRYIILSPSKLVLSTHIDLAIHLACGHFTSLGTLFLANLFEGLTRAHRPDESMGRLLPPPASDMVAVMPDQPVVLPDQVAEPQQAPIEDVVLPEPDQVVALPDLLVQQVDEVPLAAPEPVQPEPIQPDQPPHDVEEISSSKSGEASVNFAPLDPGMELADAQHLPPGDESVAGCSGDEHFDPNKPPDSRQNHCGTMRQFGFC